MKTKNITPAVEVEEKDEQEEASAEVASGGPAIAAAKKGKITIIAASTVLITVVMYFMFFKGEDKKVENLQVVEAPDVTVVAPSPDGKSLFELEDPNKSRDDLEMLQKPAAPEVPTLPALPEGTMQSGQDPLAPPPPILTDMLPSQKQPNSDAS